MGHLKNKIITQLDHQILNIIYLFFLEEIALKILSQMIYYYYNFHRIRNDDNDNEGIDEEEDDKSVMTMMNWWKKMTTMKRVTCQFSFAIIDII